MSKWIVAILLLLLIGGVFFVLVKRNGELRGEVAALEGRIEVLQGEPMDVSKPLVNPSVLGRAEKLELMRLRAEVTQLRQQVRELSAAKAGGQADSGAPEVEFGAPIAVEELVRAGAATPEEAALSLVNYLFKLNTSTNEMEIATNHPPSMSSYFPGRNGGEDFTNTTALTAGLLERADEMVSFQMGPARPGEGMPGESDPERMMYQVVPVRINYADGTSRTENITFRAGTTVENGEFNPTGSWSPRITFEMVDGRARARF